MKALNQYVRHRTERSTSQTNEYTSQTSSFCQLTEGRLHSANLLLSKKSNFAYKRNLLSSVITNRVRVDVIVCVWSKLVQSLEFNSLGPVSFTNYCHLASAERRTLYSCQFHLSLKCLLTSCLVSYQIHHI